MIRRWLVGLIRQAVREEMDARTPRHRPPRMPPGDDPRSGELMPDPVPFWRRGFL